MAGNQRRRDPPHSPSPRGGACRLSGCRGQDSNLHGGCPPRDFKSSLPSGHHNTSEHTAHDNKHLGGAPAPPILHRSPSSVVWYGHSLGTEPTRLLLCCAGPTIGSVRGNVEVY